MEYHTRGKMRLIMLPYTDKSPETTVISLNRQPSFPGQGNNAGCQPFHLGFGIAAGKGLNMLTSLCIRLDRDIDKAPVPGAVFQERCITVITGIFMYYLILYPGQLNR
jgi:hypothetical protein